MSRIIEIKGPEDEALVNKSVKVKFICELCHQETVICGEYYLLHPRICKHCYKKTYDYTERGRKISEAARNRTAEQKEQSKLKRNKTNLERYGGHPAARPEQKARTQQTCMEKYGGVSPACNEQVKEKYRKTCEQKYGQGIINAFQAESVKEKSKQTLLKKYNVININQLAENKEHIKQINQERYGGIGFASKKLKEKYEQTCLKKYGCASSNSATEVKKHRIEKIKQKYGSLHQGYQQIWKRQTNSNAVIYAYNELTFDSAPELYYYIYYHDILNENITRGLEFSFTDDLGPHNYICDFLMNNENIEIKAPCFWKNDRLVSPYSSRRESFLLAKTKCMKEHNVKVILTDSEEMQTIIKIVKDKFGSDYIERFKYES